MSLSFEKFLKPFFRLSAETFYQIVAEQYEPMAAEQYGLQEDMNKAWLGFEPFARTVVEGFYTTLEDSRFEVLVPRLNAVEVELRGVAYEGAGMGLMLLDSLLPWKNRLQALLNGPESTYTPMVYVGAGLALARLHKRPEQFMARLDPVVRWLVIDGYGFYEGFFSYRHTVEEQVTPAHLSGYARRAFDQGLGRSLWFSTGAHVDRIVERISAFPLARHADLWGGIGLACAYATGTAGRETISALRAAAGLHKSHMAVGATMAATFRQQAGNPAQHTDLACEVFCGLSGEMAAHLADIARKDLPADGVEPAYEIWRQRIQAQFAAQAGESHRHLLNH